LLLVPAMRPKSMNEMPPITGTGIEPIRAPNFGTRPRRMAVTAATRSGRMEKTLVIDITPMFSA